MKLPSPPSFSKSNPNDQPILYIALTSPTLAMYDLNEFGENMIAQRVSQVSGVAQVQIYGSQKFAVRVQADPEAASRRRAPPARRSRAASRIRSLS